VATKDAGRVTGTAPAKKTTPMNARQGRAVVLRPDSPPVDELDFRDKHDTRATESDEMAQRYAELRKDRRRDDWHYLVTGLAAFVVGVILWIASYVVMSRLNPHLNSRQVAQIVGLAFAAAGGGVVIRSAGRALRQRYARPRDQGPKST
jgi:hypothetical protein